MRARPRSRSSLCTLLLLGLVACPSPTGGGDAGPEDAARCPGAPTGGVEPAQGCSESQSCDLDQVCVAGRCAWRWPCTEDCQCGPDRSCLVAAGHCSARAGAACGPCVQACVDSGGLCVFEDGDYCSSACNQRYGPFCPDGFQCEVGLCKPTWAGTCAGCSDDLDCLAGELCNANSRRCQPDRHGPQLHLELDRIDFWWDDPSPSLSHASSSVQMLMALGQRAGQDFNFFDIPVGECQRHESTLTTNAPFPIGPALDVGPAITLANAQHTWLFAARTDDPDPRRNPSYGFPEGYSVDEGWLPGLLHTWSAPGGRDVGAFEVQVVFPSDFTTTPELVNGQVVAARLGQDLTLRWSPTSSAAQTTMLASVTYNVVNGSVVEALVQIVCRAEDSAGSITLPGALLADLPTDGALGLYLQRAAVAGFTPSGIARAQISSSLIKAGVVQFSP